MLSQLPDGYSVEIGGELEAVDTDLVSLVLYLPLFAALIVAVLIAQFNSFRKTLIIILTIPLACIGGLAGVWLSGQNMDFIGMLGMVALAGIIINNAIVLVDKIDFFVRDGLQPAQAAITGAANRLRPVLVTTLTTVFGMLPLIFMQEPLFSTFAIFLISGLLTGTLITLLVVPLNYLLLLHYSARAIPCEAK